MLTLLVLQGPDKGRRFELPDAVVTIGRESAVVPLSDNTTSRSHCEIHPTTSTTGEERGWAVVDLASVNGTYVNGVRVREPVSLRVGDQLRVGRTLMVVGVQQGVTRPIDGSMPVADSESGMDSAIMHTVDANDDSLILAVPEPSAAAMNNLQILYQLGAALGAAFEVQHAMQVVMDLVFERLKADRGLILLMENGLLTPVVSRSRQTGGTNVAPESDSVPVSSTILQHVLTTGQGVLSSNAMADRRFSQGKSVHDLGIRSALCVPIKTRRLQTRTAMPGEQQAKDGSAVAGLIYIDSSVRNYTYSPDQLRLLSAIGQQAGLAIQSATLYRNAIQSERLAAIGETTAALSHSVKNILQALRGGADVVEMGLKAQNLSQSAKGWSIVSRNLDKIYNLTLNLLAYSKERRPALAPTSMKTLIDECVELVRPAASERGCEIFCSVSENLCPVPMDSDAMHQVIMNLISNALDATSPGAGQISITADVDTSSPSPDQHFATISVADNGCGISPNLMKHVFELFHSTKGNRGTGLGLAVSKKLVDEHDGTITVQSTLGVGTTFLIKLPMQPNLPTDSSHRPMSMMPGTNSPANSGQLPVATEEPEIHLRQD